MTAADPTLDPLLHMLGLDAVHPHSWRNHFVTSPMGPDVEALDVLVAIGLVEEVRSPGFLADGDRTFVATVAGKQAAHEERARRYPPPSRGAARYDAYLELRDVYNVSFGEFLRRKLYLRVQA